MLSCWLSGRRKVWTWPVGIATQVIWIYVATVTRQWAFLPASFVYIALGVAGWRHWRATSREEHSE